MRQNADVELLVAADDRTGAFETAAALADHGAGPVPVRVWPRPGSTHGVAVVDLGSRHLTPADARDRAGGLPTEGPTAHKIDSTLRGNWADELVGRHRSSGRPVLLVPALPELGRTCVDGVVLDHGRPVHEGRAGTDVMRRVTTSRPAETLCRAGAAEVSSIGGDIALRSWLADPTGIAVADADDAETIEHIAARWADDTHVVLAGTSAIIGASAAALGATEPLPEFSVPRGPVLVACGSVHPLARAQVDEAERRGITVTYLADQITARALEARGRLILVTEIPVGDVTEPMAVAAAATLARGVSDLMSSVDIGVLVLVGGDTAGAVLGTGDVIVGGSVEPGTAWATVPGFDVPVITRSGGFGSNHALVDLLFTTLA